MDTLFWAKVKEDAIIPTKRLEDAGYDLYACLSQDIAILPQQTVLVPTGLASAIPEGYVMIIKDRSSMWKVGLKRTAGVIDSGYRGEWYVPLINISDRPIILTMEPEKADTKAYVYDCKKAIAQAVLLRVPEVFSQEIAYDVLTAIPSSRGAGGFGSTGK